MNLIWISGQTAAITLYGIDWLGFRYVDKISKNDSQLRYVCLSVRTEQLGPHWKGIREIWYWMFLEHMSRNF
jgi:hypothetical protein